MNAEAIAILPAAQIQHGLPREKYDRINALNWSRLKILARSPAHYRHAIMQEDPERTEALILGTALHVAVFEPEEFSTRVAVWDGGRRYGKEWDAFCALNKGRDLLTAEQVKDVRRIANAVRGDATASKYVNGGRAEVSLTWTLALSEFAGQPATSFQCKARIDFATLGGVLVDLKSTKDASPDAFGRQAWNLGYFAQAAWYADGYEAATGLRLPFVLVAVEKQEPHVVQCYRVPEDVLEKGREHYRNLLQTFALCRAESRWPGYSLDGGELDLALPPWATRGDGESADGLDLDF